MRNITLNLVFMASFAAATSFGANLVSNPDFPTGQVNQWVNNNQVDYGWVATPEHTATNGCVSTAVLIRTILVRRVTRIRSWQPRRAAAITSPLSAAPEPTSIGLIAGGIGLVGLLKRMKTTRQAR